MAGRILTVVSVLALSPAVPSFAQQSPVRHVSSCFGEKRPSWSNGVLTQIARTYGKAPAVCIERQGQAIWKDASVPGIYIDLLYDASTAIDGSLAVSGRALGVRSPRGFVARWKDDAVVNMDTASYFPAKLAVANDGGIWTMGWLENEDYTQTVVRFQIRRFDDPSAPPTVVTPKLRRGSRPENSYFAVARDRVAIFTNVNEYLEFDAKGNEIARRAGPTDISANSRLMGFGIWADGRIAVSFFDKGSSEIWISQANGSEWTRLDMLGKVHQPDAFEVLGVDSSGVYVARRDSRPGGRIIDVVPFPEAPRRDDVFGNAKSGLTPP